MIVHELTQDECRAFLGGVGQGRLGCSRADQPYVVPFFFYLDAKGDCLYSFSALGRKIDWMRGNPKVCVEVDEIADQLNWTSVVVFGRYQELHPDSKQDEDERRRAYQLFQQRFAWWLPGLGKLASGDEHYTPIVFRIVIDKITGRRAAQSPAGH
jgi:nitroimidazol reductase NimA-like FMN-containing flavoprotein (pyridoxamine 5'-phosphate oxidase superfamily)